MGFLIKIGTQLENWGHIFFSSYNYLLYNLDMSCQPPILGSSALSGKMLLVRIVENNKIDDYFSTG